MREMVLPSPEELINPTNKNNPGHGLVKKPTKNWYLPLNKYQDWLKKWILKVTRSGVPMFTANARAGWIWIFSHVR